MSYEIITEDLSVANIRKQLVKPGTPFTYVLLKSAPAGVDMQLAIGNQQPMDFEKSDAWRGDKCNPETNGLYLSNSAQAGTTVKIYVGNGAELTSEMTT